MKANVYCDMTGTASSWVAQQVVQGLLQAGHDVAVVPLEVSPGCVAALAANQHEPLAQAVKVVVRPLVRLSEELCKGAVVVTLWESDALTPEQVTMLKAARGVVVPCEWLAKVMRGYGILVKVARFGVDEDVYTPDLRSFPKRTVFLAAGRTAHGRRRKGVDLVMSAFLLAFPDEADVVLQVKTDADCPLMEVTSSRIQVIRERLSPMTMASWYRQGLVFVSGAACEAWGLHGHEAMACGKPLISPAFGGVMEYFEPGLNGWAVHSKPVRSEFGVGKWAEPNVAHMAELMRKVYEQPVVAFLRGLEAARSVEALTLGLMRKEHVTAIRQYA